MNIVLLALISMASLLVDDSRSAAITVIGCQGPIGRHAIVYGQ